MQTEENRKAVSALTEREAAPVLNVSVRTLQQWRLRGTGPAYCKLGRSVRYMLQDLHDYLEQGRVSTC